MINKSFPIKAGTVQMRIFVVPSGDFLTDMNPPIRRIVFAEAGYRAVRWRIGFVAFPRSENHSKDTDIRAR